MLHFNYGASLMPNRQQYNINKIMVDLGKLIGVFIDRLFQLNKPLRNTCH